MIISKEQVLAAGEELQHKSLKDIDRETALIWGARAIAAYRLYTVSRDPKWLCDAVEYHHEAVEHAADTPILEDILQVLFSERQLATNK